MARRDDLTLTLPGIPGRPGRPSSGQAKSAAVRQAAYRARVNLFISRAGVPPLESLSEDQRAALVASVVDGLTVVQRVQLASLVTKKAQFLVRRLLDSVPLDVEQGAQA